MITTQTVPEEFVRLREKLLPPYNVILHNDEYNSMDYVVLVLLRYIDGMNDGKAMAIMLAAHTRGKALIVVCPKERAEHYQACLVSAGLSVTIEAA